MEQVLRDRLLAESAALDEERIVECFEFVGLESEGAANEADIKEEDLEVAVVGLRAEG